MHWEKGKREMENELNYKERRMEKESIAKEWRRKGKMERRRDLYSKEKKPIHTKRKIEEKEDRKGRKKDGVIPGV